MSYSFSIRAATKAEALEKAGAEFDKVVASQPIHAAERPHAFQAVADFLSVIAEPGEKQDVYVSVSGSVSWRDENVITSASVNVSASLVAKET